MNFYGRPAAGDPEHRRLVETRDGRANWRRWGPYLAERQWGTVREDYSADGDAWGYLPHDHARSRAYRWGEDGLLGISDDRGRLCFALALWNGRDPILKERLFGLTGPEGNHGEDVKEAYCLPRRHADRTRTCKALYRYPQRAFPYADLVAENARRGRDDPEYELVDTGDLRRGPLLRRRRRVRQGRHRRTSSSGSPPRTAGRRRRRSTCCRRSGSATPGRGVDDPEQPDDRPATPNRRRPADRAAPSHRRLGDVPARDRPASAPSCCSPRTRRTPSGSSGRPTRTPYVKDAFHAAIVDGGPTPSIPPAPGRRPPRTYVLELRARRDRDRPCCGWRARSARRRRSPDADAVARRPADRGRRVLRPARRPA